MSDEPQDNADLVSLAADIVSAYVSNNPVPVAELPKLIGDTYAALQGIGTAAAEPLAKQEPAVSIRRSVTPDFIICLEDGKKFKSLKRHLSTHYNLSPEQYRQKWNLPVDYPMVAPNYAATRSALARASGLGRPRAKQPAAAAKPKRARPAAAAATAAVTTTSQIKKTRKATAKA